MCSMCDKIILKRKVKNEINFLYKDRNYFKFGT